ncbi:MAG: hypothetical protein L6R28_03105 [Planctomycetes bacterium]|nr:hypothetical protein [Planctomycetota bacterium]
MRSLSCRAAVAVAVLLVGASLHAATLEEIQKELAAKRDACTSLSFDQTIVMEMKNEQMSITSKGTGTVESLKKGDKYLTRSESTTTGEQNVGGTAMPIKMASLMIYDGEWVYTLQDTNGMKQAIKMKPGKEQDMGQDWVASMKENFELKVLADEKVEGEDCYVLECTAKDSKAGGTKMTISIAKSCGVPVKTVAALPGGSNTVTAKNIKVNPSIAEGRFVFKAPEGVQVMDMSQMGGMGGE